MLTLNNKISSASSNCAYIAPSPEVRSVKSILFFLAYSSIRFLLDVIDSWLLKSVAVIIEKISLCYASVKSSK